MFHPTYTKQFEQDLKRMLKRGKDKEKIKKVGGLVIKKMTSYYIANYNRKNGNIGMKTPMTGTLMMYCQPHSVVRPHTSIQILERDD